MRIEQKPHTFPSKESRVSPDSGASKSLDLRTRPLSVPSGVPSLRNLVATVTGTSLATGPPVAHDDDFLASLGAVEQTREVGLGGIDVDVHLA